MTQAPAASVAAYGAVGRLYNALMTGLVLTLVSQRDSQAARRFVEGHFRRQHLEKFLPGLKKLGLEGLPDAVACAQYHYFSNALGGVKTEYFAESDRKAWVRYPPPRWIWQGTAICGVPTSVNVGMLYGWHGHNGVSLGNPRLGFVCTGLTTDGDPGLEGYYCEYDHPLNEEERVRFAPQEKAPRFDPAKAPRLDSASWPAERLRKVERSYAMEYVRSLLPTMTALFGVAEMRALVGRTARLIGLQFQDDMAAALGVADRGPAAFARLLAGLQAAQGEAIEVANDDALTIVRQRGWKLMAGVDVPAQAFDAWNELVSGLAAAHDRFMTVATRREGDAIEWRIAA